MRLLGKAVLVGLLAGCGGTSTSFELERSDVPPGFQASPIMVWFPSEDLALQTTSEQRFLDEVEARGGEAMAGTDVLAPTRDHAAPEVLEVARDQGASTVLVVSVPSAQVERGSMDAVPTCVDREPDGSCRPTAGTTSMPRTVPGTMVVSFTLVDAASGSSIWRARVEAQNRTAVGDRPVDLMGRAMEEAAERLGQDGLLIQDGGLAQAGSGQLP